MEQIQFIPPPEQLRKQERAAETVAPIADPQYQIRLLTHDEVLSLEPEFAATGNPLPDPATSSFVGVIADNRIVAWQCVQLRLHVDPVRVDSQHARVYRSLIHETKKIIEERTSGPVDVYVFAPLGSNQGKLAEHEGMQKEPWAVYSKRLMGTFVAPVVEEAFDPADYGYVEEPEPSNLEQETAAATHPLLPGESPDDDPIDLDKLFSSEMVN